MWRRILSPKTLTLAAAATGKASGQSAAASRLRRHAPISAPATFLFSRNFSAESGESSVTKKVEDIMPIATGHEREELQAELEGIDLTAIDHPEGPFGTKEAPAVVQSLYNKRIVGCPGGEGEDEHDVVWFWLEKDKPFECPVCSQYFELKVVGAGGPPPGHEDEDEEGHHH